jgi:hypothetical protein
MTDKQRKKIMSAAKKDWEMSILIKLIPFIRKEAKNDAKNEARGSRAS